MHKQDRLVLRNQCNIFAARKIETFTNKKQLKYEEHSFYLFVRNVCILRMC